MGYDLCKEFLIEERLMVILPTDSKVANTGHSVVEFYSKRGSEVSILPYIKHLKGIAKDNFGRALVKKEDINKWTLYSVKK